MPKWRIATLALDDVGPIDTGGLDLDQDLAGAGLRGLDVVHAEHAGVAEAVHDHRFHVPALIS